MALKCSPLTCMKPRIIMSPKFKESSCLRLLLFPAVHYFLVILILMDMMILFWTVSITCPVDNWMRKGYLWWKWQKNLCYSSIPHAPLPQTAVTQLSTQDSSKNSTFSRSENSTCTCNIIQPVNTTLNLQSKRILQNVFHRPVQRRSTRPHLTPSLLHSIILHMGPSAN